MNTDMQLKAGIDPAWNTAADLGRQQIAVAAEGTCAMLRGFGAMRKIQEQTAREASSRHADAAKRLGSPCQPAELLQLQSELARFDVECAASYWRQMAAAALEMQTEMMGCASHLVDSGALLENASTLEAMQSAVPGLDLFFSPVKGAPLKGKGPKHRG